MGRLGALAIWIGTGLMASSLQAQDVRITSDMPEASFAVNGQTFTIARNQDQTNVLTGEFAKTSRPCPEFCIHPMTAAPGVVTLGELEVIDFLTRDVASGAGLLIDARLPEFFAGGAIPGAVNVPFATLDSSNPFQTDLLKALGAVAIGDGLDFGAALTLTVLDNGSWDDQATRAIQNLLAAGYPADKLRYYRGGMQDWNSLGLTILLPASNG